MNTRINTTEVEEVLNPMFENLKNLLVEKMKYEIEKNIGESSIEDFFEEFNDDEEVVRFINCDKYKKVDELLSWFRGLVWTLEGAVYDMTMDDFDFQVPSIEFESIE